MALFGPAIVGLGDGGCCRRMVLEVVVSVREMLGGLLAVFMVVLLCAPSGLRAQEQPARSEPDPDDVAARPGTVEFPGIRIDLAKQAMHVDGWFAVVNSGVRLEYVACTSRGKLHESLLTLECSPEQLQFGLILLGLKPVPEVRYRGEARELTGPRVSVTVDFVLGAESVSRPIESLLYDTVSGRQMVAGGFAFTGSRFIPVAEEQSGSSEEAEDGTGEAPVARGKSPSRFAAERSGNVIALYHDPAALLDNPALTGGDLPLLLPTFGLVELVGWLAGDERFVPWEERLPDRGTKCRLTFRPLLLDGEQPGSSVGEPASGNASGADLAPDSPRSAEEGGDEAGGLGAGGDR